MSTTVSGSSPVAESVSPAEAPEVVVPTTEEIEKSQWKGFVERKLALIDPIPKKEGLYESLAAMLNEHLVLKYARKVASLNKAGQDLNLSGSFSIADARNISASVLQMFVRCLISQEGETKQSLALPGGLGSLTLYLSKPGKRRNPKAGGQVDVGARRRFRWHAGVNISKILAELPIPLEYQGITPTEETAPAVSTAPTLPEAGV